MPYPVVHILFFVFCICAVAVNATIRSFLHSELSSRDLKQILFLLLVGSLSSLLPDLPRALNFFVNGAFKYAMIGPIQTHSFLFSFSAIVLGTLIGYFVYLEFRKAVYLGLFAEAAFLSHLLLDDATDGYCVYLYPLYGRISIFSLMDASIPEDGLFMYLINSFIPVFFIAFIIMMALFALNEFGFAFIYRSKK
jgi:membrane-bound metal-dependent hydrolase YbcI (DUF457 family)